MTTSRFVWFEYVSNGADKAKALFGELFGWTTKSVPMPDGTYEMIAAPDGRTIGGYFAAPDPKSGGSWLPYLLVGNAADATAQVTKLGGQVMKPPFPIPGIATMAVVADPHGAGFAVWQPTKTEDMGPPAAGHFCWNELAAKDADAAVSFYTKLAGFTDDKMEMPGMGFYHVLKSGGESRAGIMAAMPGQPHSWLPYVQVASADQTAEKAKKLGATIVVPPTQIPNVGRFSVFVDGQGYGTGILQP
jgi:predicted enzyme related to lactoylglutathione lyase